MSKTSRILSIVLCLLFMTWNAKAQDADSTTTFIYLESNLKESLVFADSVYLGRASQFGFNVPNHAKEIKLVPPDIGSWSIAPVTKPLIHSASDTVNLVMDFPFYYKIESIPYDVSIYLEQPEERQLLGKTPLLYTSEEPLKGMLLLAQDGYESIRLTPGEDIWNQHLVELNEQVNEGVISEKYWTPEKSSKRWLDYTAAGVALVGGILAINYKTKANRRFNQYRVSGDPTLRSGFEEYDRYAAISLGAMQAGIGVLAIRLVIK